MFVDEVHAEEKKLPALHVEHGTGLAAPPTQKNPEGQVVGTPFTRYWPGLAITGQKHWLLPGREVVSVAHAVHALAPVADAYDPAEQDVQAVVALFAYVPRGQGVHPEVVADGTQ